jgi:outer membrane murein-binding lipoprotein Lpp
MAGLKVKKDNNGGWDINLQQTVLKKWGPIGLLIFLVLAGFGSKLGEEAWAILTSREKLSSQVESNAAAIAETEEDFKGLRSEIQEALREFRAGQARTEDLLLQHITREQPEGDG